MKERLRKSLRKKQIQKNHLKMGPTLILAMLPIPWLSSTAKRDPLECPALNREGGECDLMQIYAEVEGFTPKKTCAYPYPPEV